MIRGKTRTEGDFWRRIVSGNYVRSVHMSGAIGPAKSAEYPELRVQEDAKWVGEDGEQSTKYGLQVDSVTANVLFVLNRPLWILLVRLDSTWLVKSGTICINDLAVTMRASCTVLSHNRRAKPRASSTESSSDSGSKPTCYLGAQRLNYQYE